MKYFKLLLPLSITVALVFILNHKQGKIPPIGKFINPFTGFWQNAEPMKWNDATENLCGLQQEATVVFDDRLVPHVFAKTDEDMYYLQGYITAKYRLFQMEISTYVAGGRLTEIVGEAGLESDRLMRRTGMVYGAEKAQEFIEQDTASSKLINAYCKGVNDYISSLSSKNYPIEYKLLDFKPEEWKPIKVALLLKYMANMLSIFEYDIENTNFTNKYGMEAFHKLYPDFIRDEDPIVPKGTEWNFKTQNPKSEVSLAPRPSSLVPQPLSLAIHNSPPTTELYHSALPKPDEITGSNNWAVSGTKTKSGKPILCNDPHLRLTLPSIWYEMQLVSPNMNVYGATLPGSPAVIIGFNDSIAWGVTNAGRDVRDWVQVSEAQLQQATKRKEVYKMKGGKDFTEEVNYTEFGPIVFDQNFGKAKSKQHLAMRWIAHLPSNEFKTFYQMNKGKNHEDYLAALNEYTCPGQNFVFASRSGDIAIKEQGKFPIMTEQNRFVRSSENNLPWSEYIPSEHNPHVKNPARGFVSSANQHPTDSTYPYYYPGLGVYENYRNRRINQLLTEANGIDADFMKKMHSDNYNLHAKEAVPVLLALLDKSSLTDSQKNIISSLEKWNYFNNPEEVAPVYFEVWWNNLRTLLWDEMLHEDLPMKQPNFYTTVQLLATDSTLVFYDNESTPAKESRSDIVNLSFRAIEDTLKSKYFTEVSEPYGTDETYERKNNGSHDWGTYKATKVAHMIPGLDAFSALNVYNGGNLGIINATNSSNGPSWRMVVDFGEMKAYTIYPGGQSGNPGSKFYKNGVDVWAKGEYHNTTFAQQSADLNSNKLFSVTYKPKK